MTICKGLALGLALASCACFAEDLTLGSVTTNFTGSVALGKIKLTGSAKLNFTDADVDASWIAFENCTAEPRVTFDRTTAEFGVVLDGDGKNPAWFVATGSNAEKFTCVVNDSTLSLAKGLVAGNNNANSYANFYITNSTVAFSTAGAILNTTGYALLEFVDSEMTTAWRATYNEGLKLGQAAGGTRKSTMVFENSTCTIGARSWIAMCAPGDLFVKGSRSRFKTYELQIGGWYTATAETGTRVGVVSVTDGATLEVTSTAYIGSQAGGVGTLAMTNATLLVRNLVRGYGTGHVLLDGVTIRMLGAGTLFTNLETLEIGSAGLTVDTAGYAVTINRSFSGGPVLFTGGGKVTIPSGVTIANYDATTGTSLVWTDAGTTTTISQPSGSATRTDPVQLEGNDTLVVDVASGASLALNGLIRTGVFDKQGGGLLSLGAEDSRFYDSFKMTGGTLEIGETGPSLLSPFMITNEAAGSTPVVVKADRDVTLAMTHRADHFRNPLIKRGTGDLTLKVTKHTAWDPFAIPSGVASSVSQYDGENPIDFGDGTVLPTTNYGAINVAEGRLVLDVTTMKTPHPYQMGGCWTIGNPVTEVSAQPELVVRGGRLWGLSNIFLAPSAKAGISPLREVRLSFEDAVMATAPYFRTGVGSNDTDLRIYVTASNSLLLAVYYYPCCDSGATDARPLGLHLFRAKSKLICSYRVEMCGPAYMEFDDSELMKGQVNNDGNITSTGTITLNYISGSTSNTVAFVNGGVFHTSGSVMPYSSGIYVINRQTFIFDGGIIEPHVSASTFTMNFNDDVYTHCVMRGTGLVLKPSAGQTFTLTEPLFGEGGFMNGGAGTVVLSEGLDHDERTGRAETDPISVVQYTGLTAVTNAAGVIDFDGQTLTNAFLAGAGTFTNATFETPTLVVTATGAAATDAPQFATDTAFSGRVLVDLQDPDGHLVKTAGVYPALPVASYTGAAPDLSVWKLKKGERFTRGIFAASAGVVTCVPKDRTGLVLILK